MKPPLEKDSLALQAPSTMGPRVWLCLRAFCVLMLLTQGLAVGYLIAGIVSPEWADKSIGHDPPKMGALRFFFLFFALIFGPPLAVMAGKKDPSTRLTKR